jgi:two-component system sensor histidine kinase KdpD
VRAQEAIRFVVNTLSGGSERPDMRFVTRYGVAILAPIVATLLAQWLVQFGINRVAVIFLASVLCAGAYGGVRPAVLATFVAVFTYNYYLVEPTYTLTLASGDDLEALIIFIFAAAGTGLLAGRMRDEREAAQRGLSTTQALFEASRRLSTAIRAEDIDRIMVESAAQALGAPAVIIRGDRVVASEGEPANADTGALLTLYKRLIAVKKNIGASDDWCAAVMLGRGGAHGAVAVLAPHRPRTDEDGERTLASLAGLGAVALDRSQLIDEMAETQAIKQSERLRSALLSSVSHDFRTPLAAILASSTSLLEYGAQLDEPARQDLVRSIRDESERMNRYVANLLAMTRLEAGALAPRVADVDLLDVTSGVAAHLNRHAAARSVKLSSNGEPVIAAADPVLLEQALVNVIENALTLTPAGGRVSVEVADAGAAGARIAVTDEGPGIPSDALPHVFDKFFRVQGQRERAGVGLGLSIAKGLIEAMGGSIEAQSPVADGRGARFIFQLRTWADLGAEQEHGA